MLELRKLIPSAGALSRTDRELDSRFPAGMQHRAGLEVEYSALIARQLRRFGVDAGSVSVEVKDCGETTDGLGVFVGMLRLARWERVSGLRVLLGLPMLDAQVRQALGATWLGEVSHFGGLWLNTSPQLRGAPGVGELRDLLLQLTPHRAAQTDGDASADGR